MASGVGMGLLIGSTVAAPVASSLVEAVAHGSSSERLRDGVAPHLSATSTSASLVAHLTIIATAEAASESEIN